LIEVIKSLEDAVSFEVVEKLCGVFDEYSGIDRECPNLEDYKYYVYDEYCDYDEYCEDVEYFNACQNERCEKLISAIRERVESLRDDKKKSEKKSD